MKTLREMMDQLDEITRRGFLKGAGAAAVAGAIPLGSKAQSTDYVQVANNAVRQAEQIITGYASVMTSERRSYFANYIRENVYNQTVWYLNNTNGYNSEQAINYALMVAKRECDSIKTGFGDFIGGGGLRDNMSMKVVNTFVQTYSSALQQKYQEYKRLGQTSQSNSQSSQASLQQPQGSKEVFKPEYAPLNLALTLYIVSKDINPEIHSEVKDAIGQYIKNNNNKEFVNDAYRAIKGSVDARKARDPEESARRDDSFIKAYRRIIDQLNAAPESSVKKDEFNEDQLDETTPEAMSQIDKLFDK